MQSALFVFFIGLAYRSRSACLNPRSLPKPQPHPKDWTLNPKPSAQFLLLRRSSSATSTTKQQTWREKCTWREKKQNKPGEKCTWRERKNKTDLQRKLYLERKRKTADLERRCSCGRRKKKLLKVGPFFWACRLRACIFLCIRITESCTTADTQTMGTHAHTHEIWKQPNNYAGVFSVSMTRTSIQEYIRKESGIITANRQTNPRRSRALPCLLLDQCKTLHSAELCTCFRNMGRPKGGIPFPLLFVSQNQMQTHYKLRPNFGR